MREVLEVLEVPPPEVLRAVRLVVVLVLVSTYDFLSLSMC